MHGAYVGGAVGRGWAVNSKPYRGNKVLSFRGQRCGVWGLQIRFGFWGLGFGVWGRTGV